MTQTILTLAIGTDDVLVYTPNKWSATESQSWLGKEADGTVDSFSDMYRLCGIPYQARITSAKMSYRVGTAQTGTTCRALLTGDLSITPVVPTSYADYFAKTFTVTTVSWDVPATSTVGAWIDSSDIKTIIQELVNQTGFLTTSDIQIFTKDNGSDVSAYRRFTAGATLASAPTLTINWDTPGSKRLLVGVGL